MTNFWKFLERGPTVIFDRFWGGGGCPGAGGPKGSFLAVFGHFSL